MNVVIVGSGAVAAEVTSYIDDNNKFVPSEEKINLRGYLDYSENIEKYWSKYKLSKPVLADIDSYNVEQNDQFIIAISDILFRSKMIDILKTKNVKIVNFIHYSSIISSSASIGFGNIIYPHCIIGPNSVIGDYNLITSYSFISHDCKIGNNNFLSTAGLAGRVSIGDNNFFGIRATVLPEVVIGSDNTVQAGMIVDKNIQDNTIVFHRFKEKVIAISK